MSNSTIDLVKHFEDRLGEGELLPITDLVRCGLYGSVGAAKQAIERGDLPGLKVSRNRTLIPRQAILAHIRKSVLAVKD